MEKSTNKTFFITSLGVIFPWLTILIINFFDLAKTESFFQENNYTIISILLVIAIIFSLLLAILAIKNKDLTKSSKLLWVVIGLLSGAVSTFFWFLVGVANNIRIGM